MSGFIFSDGGESSPTFDWIDETVETIVPDAEEDEWQRDGCPVVAVNMDDEKMSSQWIHAENSESWVDLEAVQ